MDGVPFIHTHTQTGRGERHIQTHFRHACCEMYTAHWHGPTLWKDAQGPAKSMVINSKCSFCLEALTNWIGTVQQAAGVYRVLQKQKKTG